MHGSRVCEMFTYSNTVMLETVDSTTKVTIIYWYTVSLHTSFNDLE